MSDIIQIAYNETQIALENEVMKAVCNVGISVNKEELLKALELSEALVRCKECRFCKLEGDDEEGAHYLWCWKHDLSVDDDDFCSYGEREGE